MQGVPFSFLPRPVVFEGARHLYGLGRLVQAFFPRLEADLLKSGFASKPEEYAGLALFVSMTNALFTGLALWVLGSLFKTPMLAFAFFAALCVGGASFLSVIHHPRILSLQRARKMDAHLIFALRQLVIQLRSGVPLFNAMAQLSRGYGEVSRAFGRVVRRIDSGVSETDALTEETRINPSPALQKVLWQVSNALQVGSDVASALDGQLDELTLEKMDAIKKYSQELSPWTMVYLLIAIILPTLGVTLFIVVTGFLGTGLSASALWALLAFLAGFQLFFLQFVSTRRPVF